MNKTIIAPFLCICQINKLAVKQLFDKNRRDFLHLYFSSVSSAHSSCLFFFILRTAPDNAYQPKHNAAVVAVAVIAPIFALFSIAFSYMDASVTLICWLTSVFGSSVSLGASGVSGVSGVSGISGVSGLSGVSGASGVSGVFGKGGRFAPQTLQVKSFWFV